MILVTDICKTIIDELYKPWDWNREYSPLNLEKIIESQNPLLLEY